MDHARSAVVEALRQVEEGADIPAPASLLRTITPEVAALKPSWSPYSILTNLAHTVFWQDLWLDRLEGRRAPSITKDWRIPDATEWPVLKAGFLDGLARARAIASTEPFEHRMKSDAAALKTLLQIAVHDSYHLGQINLLKRALRLEKRTGE